MSGFAVIAAACTGAALLAQGSFTDMGRNFRAEGAELKSGEIITLAILGVCVIIAVWILARFVNGRDAADYNNPRRLFHDLCAAHHLDRRSRRLLKRLARFHGLANPSMLFLDPERFDQRALSKEMLAYSGQIEQLRDRLFGRRLG